MKKRVHSVLNLCLYGVDIGMEGAFQFFYTLKEKNQILPPLENGRLIKNHVITSDIPSRQLLIPKKVTILLLNISITSSLNLTTTTNTTSNNTLET